MFALLACIVATPREMLKTLRTDLETAPSNTLKSRHESCAARGVINIEVGPIWNAESRQRPDVAWSLWWVMALKEARREALDTYNPFVVDLQPVWTALMSPSATRASQTTAPWCPFKTFHIARWARRVCFLHPICLRFEKTIGPAQCAELIASAVIRHAFLSSPFICSPFIPSVFIWASVEIRQE